MKKYKKAYIVFTVIVFFVIGGVFAIGHKRYPDIKDLSDNHPAVKMYHAGVWTGRYQACYVNDATDARSVRVSIDILKEMSREEMASILDYYELVWNAQYVGNSYVGERDADFTGYAVFFRGGTDEEVMRIKYMNGEEAEITEEDEDFFPLAYMRSPEEEAPRPWM